MDRTTLINYFYDQYQAKPEFLWKKYPEYAVFRHSTNRKWFGIIMNVDSKKINIDHCEDEELDILVLKLDPEKIDLLQKCEGFRPAYHMNKNHWISVILKDFTIEKLSDLIEESYQLTL